MRLGRYGGCARPTVVHNDMRLVYADHIATPDTPRHMGVHRRTLPQTNRGRKPWNAADITGKLPAGKLPADALRATADRMMSSLAAYVRHAEAYGGLRDCWEAAADELDAVELGELASETLRGREISTADDAAQPGVPEEGRIFPMSAPANGRDTLCGC